MSLWYFTLSFHASLFPSFSFASGSKANPRETRLLETCCKWISFTVHSCWSLKARVVGFEVTISVERVREEENITGMPVLCGG